jgi:ABC-type branched-subunit amino acid transport system ATPase component
MRRYVERSSDAGPLSLRPFCLGCTIATRGYDFRKGHRVAHGIGYMPEDRRLVPELVEENIRLPTWTVVADGIEARLEWIFTIMPEVARWGSREATATA